MDPLSAGDLRHRLRVERSVTGDDGYGNTITGEYAVLFVVAAKVNAQKGGEAVQAARLVSSGSVEVWVRGTRQSRQITPSDRLVNVRTGAVYEVRHIADLEGDGAVLLLTCEAAQ